MNINELLTKNITIVVAVIIVLIVVSVIITFMLLKVTESKYNDLELQNVRLIEQVKTYTNNLAKLYEEEKMISEEQDDLSDIPAPDVNKINAMPEMNYHEPVAVQPQQQNTRTIQQPVAQPSVNIQQDQIPQQNGPAPIQPIVETTTLEGQNTFVNPQTTIQQPVNPQTTSANTQPVAETVTVDTTNK